MIVTYQLNDLDQIAKTVLDKVQTTTLLFYGDMGVGKTTLIKALVKALGSNDDVSSPTFSIVNEYEGDNTVIYHFDLYRIENPEEAFNFGIEDYFFSNNWCLIEWPEKLEGFLPDDYDTIDIKLEDNGTRTLKLNVSS